VSWVARQVDLALRYEALRQQLPLPLQLAFGVVALRPHLVDGCLCVGAQLGMSHFQQQVQVVQSCLIAGFRLLQRCLGDLRLGLRVTQRLLIAYLGGAHGVSRLFGLCGGVHRLVPAQQLCLFQSGERRTQLCLRLAQAGFHLYGVDAGDELPLAHYVPCLHVQAEDTPCDFAFDLYLAQRFQHTRLRHDNLHVTPADLHQTRRRFRFIQPAIPPPAGTSQ
jgi:hypothetical protein